LQAPQISKHALETLTDSYQLLPDHDVLLVEAIGCLLRRFECLNLVKLEMHHIFEHWTEQAAQAIDNACKTQNKKSAATGQDCIVEMSFSNVFRFLLVECVIGTFDCT